VEYIRFAKFGHVMKACRRTRFGDLIGNIKRLPKSIGPSYILIVLISKYSLGHGKSIKSEEFFVRPPTSTFFFGTAVGIFCLLVADVISLVESGICLLSKIGSVAERSCKTHLLPAAEKMLANFELQPLMHFRPGPKFPVG
jgi:hypothetical protein